MLSQKEGGLEWVIARVRPLEEHKYATMKKELLAIVTFTKYF